MRSRSEAQGVAQSGWKSIFWSIYRDISDQRLVAIAAGITFYALLAIFPGLAALVSLYGLFGDPGTLTGLLGGFAGVLPEGAIRVISDQLTRIASQPQQALVTFVAGLAISLWSANAGTKALFDALNVVYGVRETRGLVTLNARSLLFTGAGVVFILLAIALVVVLPIAFNFVGLSNATTLVVEIGKWPALLVAIASGLAALYRFGPDRRAAKWRWITVGSLVASVLWLGVSILFSIYATNFGKFNETYGSLGAVIGFMTWIWLTSIAILLGAELDAELEQRRS
jgi:membrane protein